MTNKTRGCLKFEHNVNILHNMNMDG